MLYNSNLTNLNNITGGQIGAYFGYSVASGDLNGDGLDDVIVGAPMWTNYEVMGKYETGRVYIVYQNAEVSCLLFVLTTGVWGKEAWCPSPKWNTRIFFAFSKRTQLWLT